MGETRLVLDASLGDVSVAAIITSSLSITKRLDLIIAVAREGELQQRLKIDSGNTLRPALSRVAVKVATKVKSTSERWNIDSGTLRRALHIIIVARCALSFGRFRFAVLNPGLIRDAILPG